MGTVELNYFDFKLQPHLVELPLMVALVASLIFGFLIAWFMGIFGQFKLKSTIRQQNRSITCMEEEIEGLKNTPQIPIKAESSHDS